MSRIESQYDVPKPEYIKKEVFDNIVHQLFAKIDSLENKVDRLERDNGAVDSLYRKMDQLLMQLRSSYHFANEYDYEEESEYFFEDFSGSVITDDILARLLSFNNVLVTSHQAFFTGEALSNIAMTTLDSVKDFASENKLPNEICCQCGKGTCGKKEKGRCF